MSILQKFDMEEAGGLGTRNNRGSLPPGKIWTTCRPFIATIFGTCESHYKMQGPPAAKYYKMQVHMQKDPTKWLAKHAYSMIMFKSVQHLRHCSLQNVSCTWRPHYRMVCLWLAIHIIDTFHQYRMQGLQSTTYIMKSETLDLLQNDCASRGLQGTSFM